MRIVDKCTYKLNNGKRRTYRVIATAKGYALQRYSKRKHNYVGSCSLESKDDTNAVWEAEEKIIGGKNV
ncbi:MAG: hypothetical protein LBL65_05720 [Campylobacteraceae bacterium]|jgi:hypothetical protein|nr:hypothetical protein [Campylobacteraceae bacterium]